MTLARDAARPAPARHRSGRKPFGAAALPALAAAACLAALVVKPGPEIAARLAGPLAFLAETVRPGLLPAGAEASQPTSPVVAAAGSPVTARVPPLAAAREPDAGPSTAGLAAIAPAAGPAMEGGLSVDVLQSMGEELRRRGQALDAREQMIASRSELLSGTEQQLAVQIGKLEALKAELEASLDRVGEDEEARLAQLVKVYEAMKAKRAAVVFDGMELPLLLRIVRRMRDAKVAAIVEEMAPETAHRLTTELAKPIALPTAR